MIWFYELLTFYGASCHVLIWWFRWISMILMIFNDIDDFQWCRWFPIIFVLFCKYKLNANFLIATKINVKMRSLPSIYSKLQICTEIASDDFCQFSFKNRRILVGRLLPEHLNIANWPRYPLVHTFSPWRTNCKRFDRIVSWSDSCYIRCDSSYFWKKKSILNLIIHSDDQSLINQWSVIWSIDHFIWSVIIDWSISILW